MLLAVGHHPCDRRHLCITYFVTPQAATSSVSEVTAEDIAKAVAAAPGDEKGAAKRNMLIERNLRAEQELRRGDFDACVRYCRGGGDDSPELIWEVGRAGVPSHVDFPSSPHLSVVVVGKARPWPILERMMSFLGGSRPAIVYSLQQEVCPSGDG